MELDCITTAVHLVYVIKQKEGFLYNTILVHYISEKYIA